MDATLVALVGFVLALIVLDLAAVRCGVDSRDGAREFPVGSDPLPTLPRGKRRWKDRRAAVPATLKRLPVVSGDTQAETPATRQPSLAGAAIEPPRRCLALGLRSNPS